ncbi:two-component sensor histidine kinase [Desulfonema ishimotonii]|uniref:histidine kinase n=1 Tax=Desulfonema ishimotonii TaxID=45657 RepID=A0A401FU18_9BACT|nr:cache domain-containing protein [Desulfonema ishimotonii]GBC60450.1 two-component sensor histidine kinase [Desulfonema ishimotonii]
MLNTTRSKLIISFLSVSLLVGTVSLIVGGQMLYQSVLSETRNRVRQDLNVARLIYDNRVKDIKFSLEMTGVSSDCRPAMAAGDSSALNALLVQVTEQIGLDFAGVIGPDGRILCRIGQCAGPSRRLEGGNSVAELALERRQAVAGTVVLDSATLQAENPELARRATIRPLPIQQPRGIPLVEETAGLAIAAAVPIFQGGSLLGAIYGGTLLNRDQSIVDKIGDTVFKNEVYNGHNLGTATIFFRNLRVSTNVLNEEKQRAIGTYASSEVTQRVLIEGKKWTDRAFVVSDWYITAYEPITDIFNQRVGMLYVGVLEARYSDVRRNAFWVFAGITLAGMVLAIGLGWYLASRIMRPVNQLIQASIEISRGNFSPDIGQICKSDIGLLQKKFLKMTHALQEREQRHKEERESSLLQSEKQASVGKLAAGVAHEINNPLTAVLTFTHLILRRKDLAGEVRKDLETIARQTERVRKIVKGLLDFSRQTRINPEPINLNRLLRDCVRLMQNQALIRGIALEFDREENLPVLLLDRSQFQSVIINMVINALDAMEPGGKIHIESRGAKSGDADGVEVIVRDTGTGIRPEDMEHLFDPFFTTKEVGKGTGLGLAVSAGIIERHGGTISVQSEVGEGATFIIWLPLEPDGLCCPLDCVAA